MCEGLYRSAQPLSVATGSETSGTSGTEHNTIRNCHIRMQPLNPDRKSAFQYGCIVSSLNGKAKYCPYYVDLNSTSLGAGSGSSILEARWAVFRHGLRTIILNFLSGRN